MIITNTIFFAALAPIIAVMLVLAMRGYRLEQRFDKLSVKVVNLYLDKKFICKLLTSAKNLYTESELLIMLNEILDYFCLDLLALYITIQDKLILCKSVAMDNLYSQNEIKLLLNHSKKIDSEIGYHIIKNKNHRQFIVFKHPSISILTISEARHTLSTSEKNTFLNEVTLLLILRVRFITGSNKIL